MVFLMENGKYVADAEYAQAGEIPVRTMPGFGIEWAEVFQLNTRSMAAAFSRISSHSASGSLSQVIAPPV
jgi:hypothetical protein